MGRHDNLVELHLDALTADNLDAVGHALQCLEGLVLYLEVQLRGKADAAHHAQGVVAEGDVWLKGCGYDAILQVGQAVEGVYQFAKAVFVQADGHCVDGEVATVLIVLQGTVLDNGLARIVAVALAAGTDEFYFSPLQPPPTGGGYFDLRRSEVLEHREVGLTPQHALQLLRHAYAYTNGTLPLASWKGDG